MQYYEGLIALLRDKGALHLYFLEVDGQAIAGHFCYEDQEVFHVWKVGYREEFSSLSPSNLLEFHVIEDAITNIPGMKHYNMFPWGHEHKIRYVNEESSYTNTAL